LLQQKLPEYDKYGWYNHLGRQEPDYNDDDEKSDKICVEKQKQETGEITINQVF
jgi:hypothetical protein